jgi:hypothetical protein
MIHVRAQVNFGVQLGASPVVVLKGRRRGLAFTKLVVQKNAKSEMQLEARVERDVFFSGKEDVESVIRGEFGKFGGIRGVSVTDEEDRCVLFCFFSLSLSFLSFMLSREF